MIVLGQTPDALAAVTDGLVLRAVEPPDRREVADVVDRWWGRPMGGLLPRPLFSEFRSTSFVVEHDVELVGFLVGFLSQTNPDEAYIHAVAVAPSWRGHVWPAFCTSA